MIRPEALLHSNQAIDADFRAPVRLQARHLHCGLGINGYYWEPDFIQKFATHRVFVAVLGTLGLIQGASMGYFAATANVVAENFGFSYSLISWVLVSNEIAQGVLGLLVSYCTCKGNRPGWIAACITFQALTCFLLMLPQLVHQSEPHFHSGDPGDNMCHAGNSTKSETTQDTCYFTLSLMFLIQLGSGLGGIVLLSHGISYIDDNVAKESSPALIGEVIALRHLGPHLGVILAWRCLSLYAGPLQEEPSPTSPEWIGAWWVGWPIISTLMFIAAVLVAMFPKLLPSQAVKEMAASIVDLARGVQIKEPADPKLTDTGFLHSLRRLLMNKIIILNTLATVCLQTAMSNYLALEDKYLESKYYIPRPPEIAGGFHDPWTSRLIISLLRPPLVALHIMISGLVISRTRMRAGRISGLHAIIAFSVAIFMFSRIFTNCNSLQIEGEGRGRFQPLETCNRNCLCPDSTRFSPVCSQEGSFLFYSPCHAGCKEIQYVDDIRLYSKCSCVSEKVGNASINQAKGGPCNNPDCNFSWVLNQCFTVLTAALVGMRLVGNAIITFRSVQPQDKALAVGLELTLVGLIAYIPGNLIYQSIADSSCMYRESSNSEVCSLYEAEEFGIYLNVTTGCLMLCCAALSIAVWYFARNLDLYHEEDDDDDDDDDLIEMRDVRKKRNPKISSRHATPAPHRRWRSGENVGSVREEIERMKQASEPELRFDIMDISDHMEDSMEVSPDAHRQVAVF